MEPKSKACQPVRAPWTLEKLHQERAITISATLPQSFSVKAYNSHLQSDLTFCKSHKFPFQPTPDMFSFYTVYMCHHIKPTSVNSYLYGICSSLEPYYPEVRKLHKYPLVLRTLMGMKKLQGMAANRKSPLTESHLRTFLSHYEGENTYDILFLAIILVGFHALMHLGKTPMARLPWNLFLEKSHHATIHSLPFPHNILIPPSLPQNRLPLSRQCGHG